MPDPFDARARRKHFNRAVAQYHGEVEKLAREINADIAGRGLAGQGSHPKVVEAFRMVIGVVREMLKFDNEAVQLELSRVRRLNGVKAGDLRRVRDLSGEDHEQRLLQWARDELQRLPERFLSNCRRLVCKPNDLKDMANEVAEKVTYEIGRAYDKRRAKCATETGKKFTGKGKGGSKPGPTIKYDANKDEKLASDWEAARRQGAYKPVFAKEKGYTLKEFNRLLTRVRARKSRAH